MEKGKILRSVLRRVIHTIYRISVTGRKHVPQSGGALLVSNHLSYVDALLLAASIERPIRFLMFSDYYQKWWIRPLARFSDSIPISSKAPPREMVRSLRQATAAIQAGDLVCIFPEGQITRTGQMIPFRRGFEHIMKGLDVPIVPVGIDGLWGSVFSFERDRVFWKLPKRIPYSLKIHFGAAMPSLSTAPQVHEAIQVLLTGQTSLVTEEERTYNRGIVLDQHRWTTAGKGLNPAS